MLVACLLDSDRSIEIIQSYWFFFLKESTSYFNDILFWMQIEFCECPTCNLLVVTVAWDEKVGRGFQDATGAAKAALQLVEFQFA
jgi:hypothetical protein